MPIPANAERTPPFAFISSAKAKQRKLRKCGYRTRLEIHAGIASPWSCVWYWKHHQRLTGQTAHLTTKGLGRYLKVRAIHFDLPTTH